MGGGGPRCGADDAAPAVERARPVPLWVWPGKGSAERVPVAVAQPLGHRLPGPPSELLVRTVGVQQSEPTTGPVMRRLLWLKVICEGVRDLCHRGTGVRPGSGRWRDTGPGYTRADRGLRLSWATPSDLSLWPLCAREQQFQWVRVGVRAVAGAQGEGEGGGVPGSRWGWPHQRPPIRPRAAVRTRMPALVARRHS